MIKHIVVWSLKNNAEGFTKAENAERIKTEILKLKEQIPQIKKIEAGINITMADDAFDIALNSEFNSVEDLQIYIDHPVHIKFKEFILPLKRDKRVIDYYIQ